MKAAVIIFPGSNRERDMIAALELSIGSSPVTVWHGDRELPKVDLIVLPGGFSYGDYLRVGAMAAHSPIIKEVIKQAKRGVHVLGVCNGFQILTESGLLPGALIRNINLRFICKDVHLKVERNDTIFTKRYRLDEVISIPVAHHDGNYFADDITLNKLEDEGRVGFRYCGPGGELNPINNINGSCNSIAGIYNEQGNVLGMMPHPENAMDVCFGSSDGRPMFEGLSNSIQGLSS